MSAELEQGGEVEGDARWKSRPIQTNGEVTIPAEMRDRHGLTPGTEVLVVDTGDSVEIRQFDDV